MLLSRAKGGRCEDKTCAKSSSSSSIDMERVCREPHYVRAHVGIAEEVEMTCGEQARGWQGKSRGRS